MNKKTYFVVELQITGTKKGYAYCEQVRNGLNLYRHFEPPKGYEVISITAFDTWKLAKATAEDWNETKKQKGEYAVTI